MTKESETDRLTAYAEVIGRIEYLTYVARRVII